MYVYKSRRVPLLHFLALSDFFERIFFPKISIFFQKMFCAFWALDMAPTLDVLVLVYFGISIYLCRYQEVCFWLEFSKPIVFSVEFWRASLFTSVVPEVFVARYLRVQLYLGPRYSFFRPPGPRSNWTFQTQTIALPISNLTLFVVLHWQSNWSLNSFVLKSLFFFQKYITLKLFLT